jgi:DNA-binding NtrC family response regulator
VSPYLEDAENLSRILSSMPLPLTHVRDLEQARAALQRKRFDVILTEADLADAGWVDVLNAARQYAPGCEVIVTKSRADGRFWAEALNLGAYDLLVQPFFPAEVRRILGNACSRIAPVNKAAAAASFFSN